jgi:hypothetical protein
LLNRSDHRRRRNSGVALNAVQEKTGDGHIVTMISVPVRPHQVHETAPNGALTNGIMWIRLINHHRVNDENG